MNKLATIILFIISIILGVLTGVSFANKEIKINRLTKENDALKQEIIDYKWQMDQVPYIIESWCNGE